MKKRLTPQRKLANWPLIYTLLILSSIFVFAFGQWGAGLMGLILTFCLTRLVLIEQHLSFIAYTPPENVNEASLQEESNP